VVTTYPHDGSRLYVLLFAIFKGYFGLLVQFAISRALDGLSDRFAGNYRVFRLRFTELYEYCKLRFHSVYNRLFTARPLVAPGPTETHGAAQAGATGSTSKKKRNTKKQSVRKGTPLSVSSNAYKTPDKPTTDVESQGSQIGAKKLLF
jgi:hypothetical protein